MIVALMVLLGALTGALVQRFALARMARHRNADLDGWLILIEDGIESARRAGSDVPFVKAFGRHQFTPEERAFRYGWYREVEPQKPLPLEILCRQDVCPHGYGWDDCSDCRH